MVSGRLGPQVDSLAVFAVELGTVLAKFIRLILLASFTFDVIRVKFGLIFLSRG